MAIFLTGATGYIGAYVAAGILEGHRDSLNLLVRAKDAREAEARLWHALQLHMNLPRFCEFFASRIRIFRGDLDFGPIESIVLVETRVLRSNDSVLKIRGDLAQRNEFVAFMIRSVVNPGL